MNYIATWRILIQDRYQMEIRKDIKKFSNWKVTLIKSLKYKFYNDYRLNKTKQNIITVKKTTKINK